MTMFDKDAILRINNASGDAEVAKRWVETVEFRVKDAAAAIQTIFSLQEPLNHESLGIALAAAAEIRAMQGLVDHAAEFHGISTTALPEIQSMLSELRVSVLSAGNDALGALEEIKAWYQQ